MYAVEMKMKFINATEGILPGNGEVPVACTQEFRRGRDRSTRTISIALFIYIFFFFFLRRKL